MTLSLQDRRLRQAHAAFERSACDLPDPLRLVAGLLRAVATLLAAVRSARRGPDPIDLVPGVLARTAD